MSGPDAALLIRRLIAVGERVRASLQAEEWEAAVTLQQEFDGDFAQLQKVAGSSGIPAASHNDLVRLERLHAENMRLVTSLRATAGSALAEIGKVSRIGNYAPLGGSHEPAPRYLDHSA